MTLKYLLEYLFSLFLKETEVSLKYFTSRLTSSKRAGISHKRQRTRRWTTFGEFYYCLPLLSCLCSPLSFFCICGAAMALWPHCLNTEELSPFLLFRFYYRRGSSAVKTPAGVCARARGFVHVCTLATCACPFVCCFNTVVLCCVVLFLAFDEVWSVDFCKQTQNHKWFPVIFVNCCEFIKIMLIITLRYVF